MKIWKAIEKMFGYSKIGLPERFYSVESFGHNRLFEYVSEELVKIDGNLFDTYSLEYSDFIVFENSETGEDCGYGLVTDPFGEVQIQSCYTSDQLRSIEWSEEFKHNDTGYRLMFNIMHDGILYTDIMKIKNEGHYTEIYRTRDITKRKLKKLLGDNTVITDKFYSDFIWSKVQED